MCLYTCTSVWARHHTFVEFRGQLSERQFSSIMFVLGSNLTCQAWHQVILCTMPSGLTKRYVLRNRKKYLLYHTNIRVCACVHPHLYCRIVCFTIFFFWERVFIALAVLGTHCRTGWSSQSTEICPFLSLECWDWRGTLPHLACFIFLFLLSFLVMWGQGLFPCPAPTLPHSPGFLCM